MSCVCCTKFDHIDEGISMKYLTNMTDDELTELHDDLVKKGTWCDLYNAQTISIMLKERMLDRITAPS